MSNFLSALEERTVPLWGAMPDDTWESSRQIWIFYLNHYKSRPFVVGQTSIRKLTSNLDKFRFDRHVLIRYSVFNRNLRPADLLYKHWVTSKLRARWGFESATNKRNFWSLSVCLANAIYFDSLSTHWRSVKKPHICLGVYFKRVKLFKRLRSSRRVSESKHAKTSEKQLRQCKAAVLLHFADSHGYPELTAENAIAQWDLSIHHGSLSFLQGKYTTLAELAATQSQFQRLLSKDS